MPHARKLRFMLRTRTPTDDLTAIAVAVAGAGDLQEAFDTLMAQVGRVMGARACVVQRMERGWMVVGQCRGGLRLSIGDVARALDEVPLDTLTAAIDLHAIGEGVWTSMSFSHPGAEPIVMLVAGDWTILDRLLNPFAVLVSFALVAVRERAARSGAERLLLDGYTFARRLSRLGRIESVGQQIVERAARSTGAGRVALAVYRPEEDRLAIEATYGYPASTVRDVRIEQGAWVIGHVYASGRPVLVRDIRELRHAPERRKYRTFSFASVPLRAGRESLGVLSATDKIDGSAFNQSDLAALRTFGVSASLALLAARSDSEVHRLSYAATVDALTGLFNRRYLDARLHQEVERAKRAASPVAVLMADIDDFKRINDSYGHPAGDSVLRATANILRSAVRVFDVSARYGGDEFAILMPSSDHASAAACAERIRQRVAEYDVRADDESLPRMSGMTMSIGVAVKAPGETPADLIRRADLCLYQAKAEGKNRVRIDGATE
jgi:diguanylate cyclase (GGDEF)-like protein